LGLFFVFGFFFAVLVFFVFFNFLIGQQSFRELLLLGQDSKGRDVVSCYVQVCEKPKDDYSPRPKLYDNWFSAIEYACKTTDEFGRRSVARKTAIDSWKDEGRSAKEFTDCETYAIAKGEILVAREGSTALLVIGDISYAG